ncbi:MAG: hypothetical protein IKP47_05935 [Ruminococcus sp.]|nr:hypothetical protein [Ruminococcus sp.]
MGAIDSITELYSLKNDIVIDEEVFDRAVREFQALVADIKQLLSDTGDMLATLSLGYDTPAGRKFVAACQDYIIYPITEQYVVIDQICKNLQLCKNGYQSVFDEYRKLVNYMSD